MKIRPVGAALIRTDRQIYGRAFRYLRGRAKKDRLWTKEWYK